MVNGFSKGFVIILLLWIGSNMAMGQYQVKATALAHDVKDLSQRDSKVFDQNGERCALLIFETAVPKLFSFDLGAQAIEKRVNKDDEVWIWISPDVKKMTIRCTDCAPQKDYRVSLKGGNVYRAKITTGLPQETTTTQNVLIYCEHTPFSVSIDGAVPVESQDKSYHTILPLGVHDLVVSSRLYKPYTGSFRVLRGRAYSDTIRLESNYGELFFSVTPSNYTVSINDEVQEAGRSLRLEPGKYRLAIKKERYESFETSIDIAVGEQRIIQTALDPAYAVFSITASDDETEIWIDGNRRGKGRAVMELDYGTHHIEGRREGYETWENTTSEFNATSSRAIKIPKLNRQYGGLRLSFYPQDASVYIDGKMVNTEEGLYVNGHMPTGVHYVQTRKVDYQSTRDSIVVESGKMSVRDYALKPLALGKATITTDPDVGIYLMQTDDENTYRFLGHTTFTGKLPAGENVIELRNLSGIRCQYRMFINDKQEHTPVTFPFKRKLMIRTNKSGRKITLKGNEYPAFPVKANRFLKLDPMKYEINVTKNGYPLYKDSIDLSSPDALKKIHRANLYKQVSDSGDTSGVAPKRYKSPVLLQRFYDNAGTLYVGIFDVGYTFDFGGEYGGSLDDQEFKHVVSLGLLPIRYRMLGLNLCDFEFIANDPAISHTVCYRPTLSLYVPADRGFAVRLYGGLSVNLYDQRYAAASADKKLYLLGGAALRFNYIGKFPMDIFAEYKWPVKGVDTSLIDHKELLFRIGASFSVGVDCL